MIKSKLNRLTNSIISNNSNIKEAMELIGKSKIHILMIVNNKGQLLGTLTDGDIRRSILSGVNLNSKVLNISNKNPKFAYEGTELKKIENLMKENGIGQIPIIDKNRKILDVVINKNYFINPEIIKNTVLFLAGGEGSRLRPLTLETPKPLIKVGGIPIISTMINKFKDQGFNNFVISINYKKDQFIRYFKSNHKDSNIILLNEKKKLGTAGPLFNLKKQNYPYVVINGDLLTKVDLSKLIKYHNNNDSDLTIVTKQIINKIPYGVIKSKKGILSEIEEKPSNKYDVAAGIYIFSHKLNLDFIKNKEIDMPDLITQLKRRKKNIMLYKLEDYWIDIGSISQLERAKLEFSNEF